jgi:phosphoglucomutase
MEEPTSRDSSQKESAHICASAVGRSLMAPIDGLKVISRDGWFAARPSGTEPIYKLYAESFKDEAHLEGIFHETRNIVNATVSAVGASASETEGAG